MTADPPLTAASPSLRDRGLVAIEVGLNETASREHNPHVPVVAGEVAAAAVECASAGAAVVHFHARSADGNQAWTADDIYRDAMNRIAASGSAVLTYPTYLRADLSHVWALLERPPAGPGLRFGPFDVRQHVRRVQWNHAEQRLEAMTALGGDHSADADPPELRRFHQLGLVPSVGAFELGELRWAVLATRSGVITPPLCLKIFLNGTWVRGPEANEAGLDAFLSQVPDDLDTEITVVPYGMPDPQSCEALLRAALRRGHNIRVGIGDNAAAFPTQTNGALVELAVGLAAELDLSPATPADVMARFTGEATP